MIRDGIRRVFHLALRRPDRWEREVEDEIKLHLMLRAEQLMEAGHAPDAAYAEARRRFGPLEESPRGWWKPRGDGRHACSARSISRTYGRT